MMMHPTSVQVLKSVTDLLRGGDGGADAFVNAPDWVGMMLEG
jgi:CO dehydrogenase/acetyl-CoA synthase delta subunit